MKAHEIKLTEREVQVFEEILGSLKGGYTGRCPGEGSNVSMAVHSGYCRKMCAKLFPSLSIMASGKVVPCPCTWLSKPHKIRVVTRLLEFNKKGDQT